MLLEILSKDYKEFRHAPVGAVPMNTLTLVNDLIGTPFADVAAGANGVFVFEAEKARGLKAAVAIDEGEKVYYDDAAEKITNIAGALRLIGTCVQAAAIGDASVIINFVGDAV